jgi:type IV pilus assembly protein PilM
MDPRRLLPDLAARSRGSEAGPIGFQLGSDALHMLQLERRGEAPCVRAAVSLAYPGDRESIVGSPRALRALVREALRGRGFRGRRIATAMPSSQLKLMVLNYESDGAGDDADLILRLVRERIDDPLEECVVDYRSIRSAGPAQGHSSALVAVARRDAVIRHLELLHAARLVVDALEIEPVAIRRVISRIADGSTSGNALVIRCGRKRSDLTALWGRRLILYREIDFGEDAIVEQLCKSLDMNTDSVRSVLERYGVFPAEESAAAVEDPAQMLEISRTVMEILKPSFYALAEQVDKAGVYTASQSRGESIGEVFLLGAITRWPGVERLLHSLLSLPVTFPDPLSALPLSRDSIRDQTRRGTGIVLASGLALRPWDGDE